VIFVVYLSKAHFPLVEAPSGNNTNDFSQRSFEINCFNTMSSVEAFSLGNEHTSPKKNPMESLNIFVG